MMEGNIIFLPKHDKSAPQGDFPVSKANQNALFLHHKKALQDYAKTHGISMADALKNAFFDMLEDQYDIKAADEAYEAYLADPETISMAEMKKKYGV